MITIKPIPADASTSVRDHGGNPGWLHDCGAFTYAPIQPLRCGVCWSANRTGWAFSGQWQQAYVSKEAS